MPGRPLDEARLYYSALRVDAGIDAGDAQSRCEAVMESPRCEFGASLTLTERQSGSRSL